MSFGITKTIPADRTQAEIDALYSQHGEFEFHMSGTPSKLAPGNYVYTIYLLGQVADGSLGAVIVPVLVSPDIAGVAATPVG